MSNSPASGWQTTNFMTESTEQQITSTKRSLGHGRRFSGSRWKPETHPAPWRRSYETPLWGAHRSPGRGRRGRISEKHLRGGYPEYLLPESFLWMTRTSTGSPFRPTERKCISRDRRPGRGLSSVDRREESGRVHRNGLLPRAIGRRRRM